MRVYLLSILIFTMSFGVRAKSCEEVVLKKYNSDFHSFLENKYSQNSNLELFKTIGFLGKSTPSGFRMVLNLGLKDLMSVEVFKSFESSVRDFISSKARYGTDFSEENDHIFFYPKEEELPCLDDSLYLDSSRPVCSIDRINFDQDSVGELKSFLNNIFDKVAQLEIREVNPNIVSLEKNIEVLVNDDLIKNKDVKLSVSGGVCNMGKTLKKNFSCTIVGGESMTLILSVGELSDELTLKINRGMTYKLEEISGKKNHFQVLKSSLNKSIEILSTDKYEISPSHCSIKDQGIACETNGISSYVLKVVPERKIDKALFADILPENGFELKVKSDKNTQYKIISAHTYLLGKESGEELKKVSFLESDSCNYISKERKILRCKKLLTPYSVSASYLGPETIEKSVEIGSFEKFSLKVKSKEVNSLLQLDRVIVLGDGEEISPSSYENLGIFVQVKNKTKNKIEYSKENQILSSERKKSEYSLTLELLQNSKVSDSTKVKIEKYVAGDNYFFDIIKKNRMCHFNLMKFQGESDYKNIGQEEFVSKLMDIKVSSRNNSCSRVQKTKGSIQIFCSLKKDKLREEITVKLLSNGANVRTVNCLLYNDDYYEEDEEDDDDSSNYFKPSKSSGLSDDITDSLVKAIPTYMSSRYQTQPTYNNPLMYNYGYSPYSSYSPSYYQNTGMWNTMYMFNPATY